jgi:pantoate--beta-alanine ligase
MRIAHTLQELRLALRPGRVGLVPTMGAFHDGHLSLMRAARAECDLVVVSLFVNPTQFGAHDDLSRYPRDEERDARLATEAGVDVLFAPTAQVMYPEGFGTWVEVEETGGEADARPGHFRGVATVCLKLFNLVQPAVAFFGQKDAQQAVVIRRMVRDLDFPIEIVVMPTMREDDGLALSSRNAYLDAAARERATALSRALRAAERAVAGGETSTAAALAAARAELEGAGIEPEYLEARDAETLAETQTFNGRPVLIAVAARVGATRLIDNLVIGGSQ